MFDWGKYLELALSLGESSDEASARSAVSRAYYAVFCSARNWLKENEQDFFMTPSGENHKIVWDYFNQGPQRLRKKIATDGRRLRGQRNTADYDDEVTGLDNMKNAALMRAQNLLKLLGEL